MNPTTTQAVRTQSPIMAWYLARFRGMKVFTRISQPTLCVFGFVVYQQSWVLVHADQPAAVLQLF